MDHKTQQLINYQFRQYRISDALCESSIIKYQCSLRRFFSVIECDNFDALSLDHFDQFILAMKDSGASNSRIANVISAVKRIFGDLQQAQLVSNSLALDKVKKPKIAKRNVNYLTPDEVTRLIHVILDDIEKREMIRNVRMMALVILLLQTGARIGEALSIKITDIDHINREIPIIGKGNKPRTLFLKNEVIHWIDRYLSLRNSTHPHLFTTIEGSSRWRQTDVGRCFRRYRKRSGIQKHFTLHTLRHTFATSLAFDNVSFSIVQALLGHANLETTIKYYIGAVEAQQARKVINDQHFAFIPQAQCSDRLTKNS